jgi:hypothetical protein
MIELARDKDIREACSQLRTAMGNPVISGVGEQTLAGQTMRMAADIIGKAQQWRPIDTAPTDGTAIYLHEDGQVFRGYWIEIPFKEYRDGDGHYVGQVDAESFWMNNETGDRCDPTHWQPEVLPPPPEPA